MDEIDDFFDNPKNRGVASGAELSQLTGCSEGYVREFGRSRATRRVGSTLVYDREDAEALLEELQEAEEDEDSDEFEDEDEGDEEDGG